MRDRNIEQPPGKEIFFIFQQLRLGRLLLFKNGLKKKNTTSFLNQKQHKYSLNPEFSAGAD